MTATRRPFNGRRFLFAIASALALASCSSTAGDPSASKPRAEARLARPQPRPGVSPRGASVALATLECAPAELSERFGQAFSKLAASRDMSLASPAEADYRVRGYLSVQNKEGGVRLAYVWDVFERGGRRAQRLTDEVPVASAGEAPANLDDKALEEALARGADDLAAFLSNTPEAAAAASGGGGVTVAGREAPAAPEASKPLGLAAR